MRKDAEIAKHVTDGFVLAGTPIIPVHDSFVVQAHQLQIPARANAHGSETGSRPSGC